jgi:hypothetical protein
MEDMEDEDYDYVGEVGEYVASEVSSYSYGSGWQQDQSFQDPPTFLGPPMAVSAREGAFYQGTDPAGQYAGQGGLVPPAAVDPWASHGLSAATVSHTAPWQPQAAPAFPEFFSGPDGRPTQRPVLQ